MTPATIIAQAKLMAETYTNESCAIQSLTTVDDGQGGFSEQWTTVETVAGLVEWTDDSQRVVGDAPRGAVMHKLRLKVTETTQNIDPSQRIIIAARDGRPVLVFTQPKRMPQSYEILITVAAIIDVSNPEE